MTYKHNPVGIACLDDETMQKLYGSVDLSEFGVSKNQMLPEKQALPEEKLPEIPSLPVGEDIVEYFDEIAKGYVKKHKIDSRIATLLKIRPKEIAILQDKMSKLLLEARAGVWTKMDTEGILTEVEVPDTDAMILDTETFVKGSPCNSPIVAQAIGRDYDGNVCFYLWLHPLFDMDDDQAPYTPQRVSIGDNKLFVAHSAAFDFQKINERYSLEKKNIIALCTKAMMSQVAGVDDSQRWALRIKDPKKVDWKAKKIRSIGCAGSLVACYEFITGKKLPEDAKELRNIFVKAENFSEFREKRLAILEYSMLDVIYTLELFQGCYKLYREKTNHYAILAGQTIVSDALLPHIDGWSSWIEQCDNVYHKTLDTIHEIVYPYLEDLHNAWLANKFTPEGSTLENISWSYVLPFRHRKGKPLPEGWELRASWFEPFRKKEMKIKGRNIQWLLQFQYFARKEWRDVYYESGMGWVYYCEGVPHKLPNKRSPGENFGNLLSSDALDMVDIDKPVLRSKLVDHDTLVDILQLVDSLSTYIGFSKRVKAQNLQDGLIAAEVSPCGTISGRTVSSLFNTLPAHYDKPKVMSEIKSTMVCPDGWVFVGGDADQQESSVAAAMADSYSHHSGAEAFSRAVLTGDKNSGTDFHSLTAKAAGVSRTIGKNINYGLIYGAGVKTTANTIAKGYVTPPKNVHSKAKDAINGFKGAKDYNDPTSKYQGGIASAVFNKMEDIIKARPPKGQFFGNEWPLSLQPKHCYSAGSPAQLNYCIQASCSTYGFLSAWALAIEDEIDRRGLQARFSISIHDELWHLCKEEDALELAFVYQICYARVWGLLHYNLWINDMPVSRAFMSGVSIDKVLRKSPKASTKSPTYPEYPTKGKEYTIYELTGLS